jgi:DNA-binding transcriptional ArsR family regulator
MSLLADNIPSQEIFSALADPTRRSIIELLATNGQMSATNIYSNFDVTPPAVSQHLKVLREANLVQLEKSAQKHLYSLNPKKMHSLENWVKQTTELWEERFDRLDTLLEAEKRTMEKRR